MIKVIAFDLDDTLWHVDPVIIRAEKTLNEWLRARVPVFEYDLRKMNEVRDRVLSQQPELPGRMTELRSRVIECALTDHGVIEPAAIATEAMEIFLVARNQVKFFEGAISAIIQISAKYQLGALTNGNADIDRLGLRPYFTFAFSAEVGL